MKNSSKFLLYQVYSEQHLRTPDQLVPMVDFELIGSDAFKSEMAALLPHIKTHFWRYFGGIGHP